MVWKIPDLRFAELKCVSNMFHLILIYTNMHIYHMAMFITLPHRKV